MKLSRIHRTEYFKELARLTSKRSTCLRAQVGCVLVDPETNRIASVGYNSAFKKEEHCSDSDCLLYQGHCIRCPHAEIAALANLPKKYDKLIAYVTHQPCYNCYKTLLAFNVLEIYYDIDYVDKKRQKLHRTLNNKLFMIKN